MHVAVRGQLGEVGSLLQPCGPRDGAQIFGWWEVANLLETSCWYKSGVFSLKGLRTFSGRKRIYAQEWKKGSIYPHLTPY